MRIGFCRFGSTRSQVRILSPRLTFQGLAKGEGRDLGRDSQSLRAPWPGLLDEPLLESSLLFGFAFSVQYWCPGS